MSNAFIIVFLSIHIEVPTTPISSDKTGSGSEEQGTEATSPGTSGNSQHRPEYLKCAQLGKLEYTNEDRSGIAPNLGNKQEMQEMPLSNDACTDCSLLFLTKSFVHI